MAVLLKTWLRELPQGLIPAPFQARLLSSTSEVEIVNGLDSLPPLNRATLCLLFNFLRMVANTTENRMSASALAVCIGPSLFRVPINTEGLETQNRANEIAHKFIKNYSTFFKRSSSDVPDQNDNCPKINSPTEKRSKIELTSSNGSPRTDSINGKDSASPINQLTPPTTPPRTPSPKGTSPSLVRAVDDTINRFFDDDHSPTLLDDEAHKRLKLPARSAPLRGSRKKPTRFHRQTMSTSQESISKESKDSSNSHDVTPNAPGVFERLKDGESLEGWRNSPSLTTSHSPGRNSKNSLVDAFDSNTVQNHSTDIHIPKLDLSAVVNQHEPSSPSPALSPVPRNSETKSILSDRENEIGTALSTLCNTPGTSPEPEIVKIISDKPQSPKTDNATSSTDVPVSVVAQGIEKIHIKEHSSRQKSSDMGTITPHAGIPSKERGRSRGRPKPKKDDRSKLLSPQSDNGTADHVSRLIVAVSDLESRMNERRQISNRVDDVSRMTELQLREEKSELQRELLVLESQFGRPQAGPERQAVRMIYHRYRELKKKLSDLDNRSAIDHESALREVEIELSRIERERRELGRKIKNWEARFRAEHNRNPSNEEKINHHDYIRYRHLKSRRNFLQELQQQKAPESFTV